tara:strand:+ start:159157 stop:161577 length:2421 start_codon:yes stop_codon:yes gene_type:complete
MNRMQNDNEWSPEMTYEPQPRDTSDIQISPALLELTEELARNTHEVWAEQRIKDGWTWGKTRDDDARHHPDLVPYDELDESAKQYDRNTALETLKLIQAFGYVITPPGDALSTRGHGTSLSASALLQKIQQAESDASSGAETSKPELTTLLKIWDSRNADSSEWNSSPEVYRRLARRFIKLGDASRGVEVARIALSLKPTGSDKDTPAKWHDDVQLRQIQGHALTRCGHVDKAQQVLLSLYHEGAPDEETLGLLARTYKDQAFAPTVSSEEQPTILARSLELYEQAYVESDSFWTGSNVATLNRLLGKESESKRIATDIRNKCLEELTNLQRAGKIPSDTLWHLATLGEAALNLGNFEQAENYYSKVYKAAPGNFGDLITVRRHARWLLEWWRDHGNVHAVEPGVLDEWIPISKVVVFSGHMIDRPDRSTPRFPPKLTESVQKTIEKWIDDNKAFIGYSSAACGSDLLFQQAIQKRGGASHIVLPYDRKQFRKDSVEFAGDEWSTLFDEVLKNATQVTIASPQRTQGDGISYDYANQVVHGLATIRARELRSNNGQPLGLVVWNNQPGDGPGGTASIVNRWRCQEMRVNQIDLSASPGSDDGLLPIIHEPGAPEIVCPATKVSDDSTQVRAMLFGDAVNFSKLDETQVVAFMDHFMTPIAGILKKYAESNIVRNTWGDGLYLVFKQVKDAGNCALDICHYIEEQIPDGWDAHGLPEDLNIRIALHTGPVLGCDDPITERFNCTGTHVSRAARLEPKTPPGQVYASQAFAAMCAEDEVMDFHCEYVEQLNWAKSYGSFPTFVLRRAE